MPAFLRRNSLALAVLALAAVLRVWSLDLRPPHFDEGVNGWFADQIQRNGSFRYDPTNYHGPLHFYALFLSKCLFGRNLWALRGPVVLAGLATVALLLFPMRRFFPARMCVIAGLAMAVSPAFVYYHRDAIHETWLVLFLVMAFLGWVGLWQRRARADLWMAAAGVTGMVLTKETYALHLGCALLAWPCAKIWSEVFPSHDPEIRPAGPLEWRDVILAVGSGLAVIVFFYSATFYHFGDLKGLYLTFSAWAETGAQNKGHLKSWPYWLGLMARYEWFTLLGLAASFRYLLAAADARLRGLSIYALGVLTAYTIIPYKTPWCVIAIAWPFLLLGAAWVAEWMDVVSSSRGPVWLARAGAMTIVFGLGAASGIRAWRLNFHDYANEHEAYVYVQTFENLANFTDPVLDLARLDRKNLHLRGFIVGKSSYPIPWLLGDFTRVGYYRGNRALPPETPDFVLVSVTRLAEVEARLDEPYYKEMVQLFPGAPNTYAFLRASVFARLMEGRTPEFMPGAAGPEPAPAAPMEEDEPEDDTSPGSR